MTAALEVSGLSVSLERRHILHGVSLSVCAGEFVGVIGPNGAGKSTLLKSAAGILAADAGEVSVNGRLINALSPTERARLLAFLPQARPVFWSMPARAIVSLGRFAFGAPLTASPADDDAVARALEEAGASHLAERPVGSLSGGELARVHLARTLAGETPIVIADEPVAALDPAHQLGVMSLLRAKADAGRTIIAALHELPLAARYCTRLVVLSKGYVAADAAPRDVLTETLLRDVFTVALRAADADAFNLALDPLV